MYEVALHFLLPQNRLKSRQRYYVGTRPLIRRFGHKRVYHAINELNRRYHTRIEKPITSQYGRPCIWEFINHDSVIFLSAAERKEYIWDRRKPEFTIADPTTDAAVDPEVTDGF